MQSSLIENLPLDSSASSENDSCKISSKPRRSWKEFIHRRNGKRVYVCNADSCNKVFNYLSSLVKHERIHRGERPYSCKVCHQSFVQSSNLKRHEKTHTGEKTFECTQCQKKFSTASNLRQHMQIHKDELLRKHYKCDQCGRTYLYSSSLNKHSKFCKGSEESEDLHKEFTEEIVEPALQKQIKIEEKIEESSSEIDQKSQPETHSEKSNPSNVLQSNDQSAKFYVQQPQLLINPMIQSYPLVNTVPYTTQYIQPTVGYTVYSAKEQLLNKLLLQRQQQHQYNSLAALQQQQSAERFGYLNNPTANIMPMNELPQLLYQQKLRNNLLQQANLGIELRRITMF